MIVAARLDNSEVVKFAVSILDVDQLVVGEVLDQAAVTVRNDVPPSFSDPSDVGCRLSPMRSEGCHQLLAVRRIQAPHLDSVSAGSTDSGHRCPALPKRTGLPVGRGGSLL